MSAEDMVAFKGEVMLIGWDEKHNTGRTARFLFDEEGVEHPMKQHTVRRGKQAGTRFMMVLVELQDDDTPIDQTKRERLEEAEKGGPVSKNAGILCNDPDFQDYVSIQPGNYTHDEMGAADFVREHCNISSRAQLDHQPQAARRYEIMKAGFLDWQQEKYG